MAYTKDKADALRFRVSAKERRELDRWARLEDAQAYIDEKLLRQGGSSE
jgi:hypothetical protein